MFIDDFDSHYDVLRQGIDRVRGRVDRHEFRNGKMVFFFRREQGAIPRLGQGILFYSGLANLITVTSVYTQIGTDFDAVVAEFVKQ